MKEFGISERDIYIDKQSGKDFNTNQYKIMLNNTRVGYDLNWGNVDKEELLEASIMSVDNYKVLITILEACVD